MSYLYQEDESSYPPIELNQFEIDDLEDRLLKRFHDVKLSKSENVTNALYSLYENLYEAAYLDRKDINAIMQYLRLQFDYCDKEIHEFNEKSISFANVKIEEKKSEYLNIFKR